MPADLARVQRIGREILGRLSASQSLGANIPRRVSLAAFSFPRVTPSR